MPAGLATRREWSPAPVHIPVAGAEDEEGAGFRHGHRLLLQVQLREGAWAGAHGHLGLLLIFFSCRKKAPS